MKTKVDAHDVLGGSREAARKDLWIFFFHAVTGSSDRHTERGQQSDIDSARGRCIFAMRQSARANAIVHNQ